MRAEEPGQRTRKPFVISCVLLVSVSWLGLLFATAMAEGPDVATLASLCSGCHTTRDDLPTSVPRIRGLPAAAIVDAMHAFREGRRQATVMDRIAKGFTDDEIAQLAAYFSQHR